MASPSKVNDLMTLMTANFVNYKLMPETVIFYSKILSDVPDDILEAAMMQICSKSGAFFPSVGDWRQVALDIMLNKAGIPSAYEAWEELRGMIGEKDHGRPVECDDGSGRWYIETIPGKQWSNEIAKKVAYQLGWPDFPNQDSMSYERHAFIEAYEDACRRIDLNARTLPDVKRIEDKYSGNVQKSIAALVESKEE